MKIGKIKQTKHFHGDTNYTVKESGFITVATATLNSNALFITTFSYQYRPQGSKPVNKVRKILVRPKPTNSEDNLVSIWQKNELIINL